MKRLLPILVLLSLSGCVHTTYEEGGVKFSRTQVLTTQQIGDLSLGVDGAGKKTLRMKGYSNEQTEALAAIAEGIARGATKP
jgi:hypothetical protein